MNFKALLIKLGFMAEPTLDKAVAGAHKVIADLEEVVDFHKAKQEAADALARAKALEAKVAQKAQQDAAAVAVNFKKLLNLA
jgi:prefoldin subunit 5